VTTPLADWQLASHVSRASREYLLLYLWVQLITEYGGMYLPPYFFCHKCHNTFFPKNIVLCAMSATQYFLKK